MPKKIYDVCPVGSCGFLSASKNPGPNRCSTGGAPLSANHLGLVRLRHLRDLRPIPWPVLLEVQKESEEVTLVLQDSSWDFHLSSLIRRSCGIFHVMLERSGKEKQIGKAQLSRSHQAQPVEVRNSDMWISPRIGITDGISWDFEIFSVIEVIEAMNSWFQHVLKCRIWTVQISAEFFTALFRSLQARNSSSTRRAPQHHDQAQRPKSDLANSRPFEERLFDMGI